MKRLISILCLAAGLGGAAGNPADRRPHPPTTRPPDPGEMARAAPEPPPPFLAPPAEDSAQPPDRADATPAGVAGYMVFVASALLFFRKAESS